MIGGKKGEVLRKKSAFFRKLDELDIRIAQWLERIGHIAHRVCLGVFFIWLGILKTFGVTTATSLIAKVVYWGDPETLVPLLGWWEVAIGVCILIRPLIRIALVLLVIRLPGTLLALVVLQDICFFQFPFAPTIEGQYLIKDAIILSAALIMGGTVRQEDRPPESGD